MITTEQISRLVAPKAEGLTKSKDVVRPSHCLMQPIEEASYSEFAAGEHARAVRSKGKSNRDQAVISSGEAGLAATAANGHPEF